MFWEPQGVFVRYYGTFTPADALGTANWISGNPRMEQLRFLLLDLRGVAQWSLGPAGVRGLESAMAIGIGAAHTNPRIVIAVLLPDHADRAALQEVFSTMPFRYAFFRTEADARDWISGVR